MRKCQSENLQGLLKKFKKYMKLEKSKKKLNDAKKQRKSMGKEKNMEKGLKKELEIECIKCGEKGNFCIWMSLEG